MVPRAWRRVPSRPAPRGEPSWGPVMARDGQGWPGMGMGKANLILVKNIWVIYNHIWGWMGDVCWCGWYSSHGKIGESTHIQLIYLGNLFFYDVVGIVQVNLGSLRNSWQFETIWEQLSNSSPKRDRSINTVNVMIDDQFWMILVFQPCQETPNMLPFSDMI